MIDINLIRETPELVKKNLKKKFQEDKNALVDEAIAADKKWRELKQKVDNLRAERNKLSLEVNKLKKSGKDASKVLKEVKGIPDKIAKAEEQAKKHTQRLTEIMLTIPNIIHKSVPKGKDASENVEIEKIGKPKKFDFVPKNHIEIGEALGMLDFDTSAETSGKGFYYLKKEIALLNMALINFSRDFMVKKGYDYIEPPLMIRENVLSGVYSHAEIEAMSYKVDGEDLYLIATSEHPMIGMFINKLISKNKLPVKLTGYSMCFRKEIGSHGIEEKGLFRTHQFNKQEMVVICEPEDSYKYYEEMSKLSAQIFKKLGIPTRRLECCSGDLGDLKAKSEDLEAWSPVRKEYYEICSLTNMEAAQARRLNIKITDGKEKYFAHTLNNTVIATSRALVAILENFQNKDGSVDIPKVLHPYTGFKKIKARK
jgi:seryl-tRNA synthetase